jgi:hypothetical protein
VLDLHAAVLKGRLWPQLGKLRAACTVLTHTPASRPRSRYRAPRRRRSGATPSCSARVSAIPLCRSCTSTTIFTGEDVARVKKDSSLEFAAEIALVRLTKLETVGEFDRALAPADDLEGELLVLLSVDPELLLAEP